MRNWNGQALESHYASRFALTYLLLPLFAAEHQGTDNTLKNQQIPPKRAQSHRSQTRILIHAISNLTASSTPQVDSW